MMPLSAESLTICDRLILAELVPHLAAQIARVDRMLVDARAAGALTCSTSRPRPPITG